MNLFHVMCLWSNRRYRQAPIVYINGGRQSAEGRGVFDFFTEILLPDTVEQALTVFDFYFAQQNQVTDNRIRQVTSPRSR